MKGFLKSAADWFRPYWILLKVKLRHPTWKIVANKLISNTDVNGSRKIYFRCFLHNCTVYTSDTAFLYSSSIADKDFKGQCLFTGEPYESRFDRSSAVA